MTQIQIESFLTRARELAKQAALQGEVPVGAVVLSANGKVIGEGLNTRETDQNPLGHAEIQAIRNAALVLKSWRLEKCTLVVTLEPCFMCLGAIQQARIENVFYGTSDPKMGALSLGYKLHEDARTNHRFTCQCLEDKESGKLLSDFFAERRAEKRK